MTSMSGIAGYISPAIPQGEQESPTDRACQAAVNALDDLDTAIALAKTRGELILLRTLAQRLIDRLEMSWATAMTYDEHFDDMRGR